MNFILLVDLIGFAAFASALVMLVWGWKRVPDRDTRLILIGIVCLIMFSEVTNALVEFGLAPWLADSPEYSFILLPPLWAFFFYVHLQAQSRRELEAGEARYRAIVQTQNEFVARWKPDGTLTFVNEAYCRYHARPAEKLIGTKLIRESAERSGEPLGETIAGLTPEAPQTEHEFCMTRSEGSIVWHRWTHRAFFDEDGSIVEVQSTGRDITERVESANRILLEKEFSDRAIDSVPGVFYLFNSEGKYLRWNENLAAVSGYTSEEIAEMSPESFFAGESLRLVRETIAEIFREGKGQIEADIRTKDGRDIPYFLTGMRIMIDGEACVIGMGVDITRRREAIEDLQRSERRYRSVVATIGDVIYTLSPQGKLTSLNPAFETITGWKTEEWIGKPFVPILHPDDLGAALAQHKMVLTGVVPPVQQFRIKTKSDEYIHAEFAVVPVIEDGRVVGTLGVGRDVTERIRAEAEKRDLEAQIQHVQKLESLGVLAGGVAHDFNNLLTGILGNASLVMMDTPEGSSNWKRLRDVAIASERAAELCHELLAYSGRTKFIFESFDLGRLVAEMGQLLDVSISKKVKLKYESEDDLPPIQGDPAQLRQVVMNLITNASDAIGDRPGTIRMTTGSRHYDTRTLAGSYLNDELDAGEYVFVEIQDDGCGMNEETVGKLFEPFFTTKFQGRGLGLAAAMGIVRGHRGAIFIDSRPGRGTTFRVIFPASERPAPAEEAHNSADANGWTGGWTGEGTILIIDDEEAIRDLVSTLVGTVGFTPLTAADGREGVELFKENAADIVAVVVDRTMPEMNGEEVIREISRIRERVRFIVSSGYLEDEWIEKIKAGHDVTFIEKPYRPRTFMEKLRGSF